jgi:hypothetical protein
MRIKRNYEWRFGKITNYDSIERTNDEGVKYKTGCLEYWIEMLGKEKYINWAASLQFTYFDNMVLIRYGLHEDVEGMWTDKKSILRECRSVVINLEDEELVLTPFKKFFNLNEIEENRLENVLKEIKKAKSVECTNKKDGSMQFSRFYHNKIVMAGTKALDPKESWRLVEGYSWLTGNHKLMIESNPDLTFIFEYISLKDVHVVMYEKEEEGLYLIGIREVNTGKEYSYAEVKEFADIYDVKMTEIENRTFDEIMEAVKQYKSNEKEGWVINIDGHRIKLKCDDYVQLHRILTHVSSINLIIKAVSDGYYDDLISKVPDVYRKRVNGIAKMIYQYIHETEFDIQYWYNKAPKDDRKTFFVWVNQNVPKDLRAYVSNKYLGYPYHVIKSGPDKQPHYKLAKEMGINGDYSAIFSQEE